MRRARWCWPCCSSAATTAAAPWTRALPSDLGIGDLRRRRRAGCAARGVHRQRLRHARYVDRRATLQRPLAADAHVRAARLGRGAPTSDLRRRHAGDGEDHVADGHLRDRRQLGGLAGRGWQRRYDHASGTVLVTAGTTGSACLADTPTATRPVALYCICWRGEGCAERSGSAFVRAAAWAAPAIPAKSVLISPAAAPTCPAVSTVATMAHRRPRSGGRRSVCPAARRPATARAARAAASCRRWPAARWPAAPSPGSAAASSRSAATTGVSACRRLGCPTVRAACRAAAIRWAPVACAPRAAPPPAIARPTQPAPPSPHRRRRRRTLACCAAPAGTSCTPAAGADPLLDWEAASADGGLGFTVTAGGAQRQVLGAEALPDQVRPARLPARLVELCHRRRQRRHLRPHQERPNGQTIRQPRLSGRARPARDSAG